MKKLNLLVSAGTLLCAVATLLALGAPASAQVNTTPMDSSAFTFKYEGEALTGVGNLGGWGNTGYLATSIGAGVTFVSNGSVLEIKPTAASPTSSNIAPHASQNALTPGGIGGWVNSAVISDSTGVTLEIRMRMKTAAEIAIDCNCTPTTFGAGGSRFAIGNGDGTNGVFAQLDNTNTTSSLNLGAGTTGLSSASDDFHVYRFAQGPNSNITDIWRDGVFLASPTGTESARNRMGNFTGFTSGAFIDYIRYEVGGFAPVPEPGTVSMLLIGSVAAFGWRRRR